MRVELLYWDGDRDYMSARQNLVEVLTEDAFETTIQMVAVSSVEDASFLDFAGSPTIRIDGVDVDPSWSGAVGLYQRDYGGTSVPSKDLIRAAVDRARGWSHGRR